MRPEVARGKGKLTVDEGVQDGHGTVGDTSVRVDLLEDCWLRQRMVQEIACQSLI